MRASKIVRPIATPRLTAAALGVSRKMADVLNRSSAQWEPRLLADLYAAAALEADDAHGTGHDLITQHYGIKRGDLVAVLALASGALDGQHGVPGEVHHVCTACGAVLALGRIRNAVQWTATT